MVKLFPRFSKKRTGEVSIKDGKFKMETKEKWRFWSIIVIVFVAIFVAVSWLLPWAVAGLALAYAIALAIATRAWRSITYTKDKVTGAVTWTGKWVIKQPINDFRYGRKKRKEMEDSKVYAK